MFGRSRSIVFDPYRRQRRRGVLPRWAWLLIAGLVLGASGVIVAQERWLPPRLSASESTRLRHAFEQADDDRNRLQQTLDRTTRERDEASQARDALARQLERLAVRVKAFDGDLAFAVDALPPDPREAPVQVRALQVSARDGTLRYAAALSHGTGGGRALDGVLQWVVNGPGADGRERSVDLQPVALRVEPQDVVRGELPLPSGFTPRQATLRIVEAGSGRRLGMRIVPIR